MIMFGCCDCCVAAHQAGHADACQKHQRAEGAAADRTWRGLTTAEKIQAAT